MIKNTKKISSFLLAFCLLLTAFITSPILAVDSNITEIEEIYNVDTFHFYPFTKSDGTIDDLFYNGPYGSTKGYTPYWRWSKEYIEANRDGVNSLLEPDCFRANGDVVTYCLDLGKAGPDGIDMKYQSEDLDNRLNRVIKMGYPNKTGADYGTSDVELEWATAVALKIVEGHEWRLSSDKGFYQKESDLTLEAFTNGVLDETFSRKYYNDKQLTDEQIATYHEKALNAKALVETLVAFADDASVKLDSVSINTVSNLDLPAGETQYMAGPFRADLISNSSSKLDIKVSGASSDYEIVDINGNVLNNVSFGQDFYIKGTTTINLNIKVQVFASDLSTTPIRVCYASDKTNSKGIPYQRMYVAKSVTPQTETNMNVTVKNPKIRIEVYKQFDNPDIDFSHSKIDKNTPQFEVVVKHNNTNKVKKGTISNKQAIAYTFEIPITDVVNEQVFTIKETIPDTFPENRFSLTDITTTSTDGNITLEKVNGEYKLTLKNGVTSDVTLRVDVTNHLDSYGARIEVEKITTGTDRAWKLSGLNKADKHEFSLGINNNKYIINDKGIKAFNIYPGTYIFEEKDLPEIWTFIEMRALNSVEGITFEKYTDTSYRLIIENTIAKDSVLKLQVENKLEEIEDPKLCLKINKKITGTDDAFKRFKLDKNAKYDFKVSLKNQATGEVIKAVIDNKNTLTIKDIPFGTYLITEEDDMYFDFVSMIADTVDGVTFTESNDGYLLTIGESVKDDIIVSITVNNKIEPDRPYEDKEEKENLFKK